MAGCRPLRFQIILSDNKLQIIITITTNYINFTTNSSSFGNISIKNETGPNGLALAVPDRNTGPC